MRPVSRRGTEPLSRAGRRLARLLADRSRLAICLDVDGTVAPIAPRPHLARVPQATRRLLHRLRAHQGVCLILVSGRRAVEARRLVAADADWTIGNHGFEAAHRRGAPSGFLPAHTRRPVRVAVTRIRRAVARLPGVHVEDKGWTLAVHFRGAPRGSAHRVWHQVDLAVRGLPVRMRRGKEIIDVRPDVAWHKGKAVAAILERQYGAAWRTRAGVVYAGDDTTDEDAFEALRRPAVTIKIGRGPTRARYRTASPASLAKWLRILEGLLPS